MSSGSFEAFSSAGLPLGPLPAPPNRAPVPPPLPASHGRKPPIPQPIPIPRPVPIPLPPADKSVVDPTRKQAAPAGDPAQPIGWRVLLADLFRRRELRVTTISSILHMIVIIVLALITIRAEKNRMPILVASPDVEKVKPDLAPVPEMATPSVAVGPAVRAVAPPKAVVKAPLNVGMAVVPRTTFSLNDMILSDSTKTGGAGGADSVSFFGSSVMAQRVIFVVDNSQSMQGQRFERAKEELLTAVSNLSPRQRFYVYFFSDRDYPMLEPKSPTTMVTLDTKMWEALLGWVNKLELYGDTRAESALRKAYALKPDVIYLLTDGDFSDETFNFLMKMKYSKVRVNTIGFDVTDTGRDVLKKIAETLKGEFTEVR